MKTRTLILALIASLLNMTAIFASDRVVSIKSEKLNEMQIATLEYAQKILKERNNELILPLELFSIVGDTTQKDCPDAIPQWDNAYFKEDADWKCNLMIPLKAKTSLGVVNSTLCVRTNNKEQFLRIVVTSLPTKEYLIKNKTINISDSKYSGYSINSNIDGVFLRAFYYDKGAQVYQIEGVQGNVGVSDPAPVPYKNRYRHNKPDYVQSNIAKSSMK